MAKSASRLGRGLNSLIGGPAKKSESTTQESKNPVPKADSHNVDVSRETSGSNGLLTVAVTDVRPNPHQPRSEFSETRIAELAESITRQGLLQPIVVRKTEAGGYELIAGERRLRAAKVAGIDEIPAILREATDEQSMEIALIENLQREDLAPLERAAAYKSFIDNTGVNADELAARLGESRSSVSNHLRLLRLPEEVRELLRIGELGMGQARAIAGIADEKRQLGLARMAVRRNLSVRQVEALVRGAAEPKESEITASAPPKNADQRHADDLAREFSRQLGMPVKMFPGRKKNAGRLVIQYKSLDEFDQIADRLGVMLRD